MNFIILSKKQILFTYCNTGAIFSTCLEKFREPPEELIWPTCGLRSPLLYNMLSVFIWDKCFNIYLCEVHMYKYMCIYIHVCVCVYTHTHGALPNFLELSGSLINAILNIFYRRGCTMMLEVECDSQMPEYCWLITETITTYIVASAIEIM